MLSLCWGPRGREGKQDPCKIILLLDSLLIKNGSTFSGVTPESDGQPQGTDNNVPKTQNIYKEKQFLSRESSIYDLNRDQNFCG